MPPRLKKILLVLLAVVVVLALVLFLLARKEKPETITYGISFNTFYAEELGLDPREVYDAFLDDLGVRHRRAHDAHMKLVRKRDVGGKAPAAGE